MRVKDQETDWRIFYYVDSDAVVILAVEKKTTSRMTVATRERCQNRLRHYRTASEVEPPGKARGRQARSTRRLR